MNHGTTASLICPACGQAFLSMQHAMEGVAQCPHCAHTAPRAHFGVQAQVAGVAQVRRRVAQAPAEPPHAAPSFPAPQPGWAAPPLHQGPAAFPPSAHPPQAAPGEPPRPWEEPPPPAAQPFSVARPMLQASAALMPVHTPPPPVDFITPAPHFQAPKGRRGLLLAAVAAAGGLGLWIWWDHAHTPLPPALAAPSASSTDAGTAVEVRRAQVPLPSPPPPAKLALEDTQAYAADAKQLVTDFFAAATPEARAACVHDGSRHSADIEALFGPEAPHKIELRQLAHLPAVVLSLPGGRHVPLFKLVTSRCPVGALLRLETGADGRRRLFWPLLAETHEGRLGAHMQQQPAAEPAWFYVALRPSHGLDLPAELRPKYLTFDVQITAASEPHLVACVERDTPLGRFMDRESDWGRVYLARLLVRRLDIEGADAPCMTVVDCEGAPER